MTAGDRKMGKRTGQLVTMRLRAGISLPAGTELQTCLAEWVARAASLQGAAASTSTSTLNSGRVKPDTITSVEAGRRASPAHQRSRADI